MSWRCINFHGNVNLCSMFGYLSVLIGAVGIIIVSLVPLGLMNPYSKVANGYIHRPTTWGGDLRPINNIKDLYKLKNEELDIYYQRLTMSVFNGVARFWDPKENGKYTRVHVLDNYLLWAYAYLPNKHHWIQWEFSIPEKALARGYGVCSQTARIVYYILKRQGIQAKILGHTHHVVVVVPEGIIDANYGIFIPRSMSEMRRNPSLAYYYYKNSPVMKFYNEMRHNPNLISYYNYKDSPYLHFFEGEVSWISAMYQEKGGKWTMPQNHDKVYAYLERIEVAAEKIKWLPPLFFILLGLFILRPKS